MVVYITEKSLWAGPTREKREELVGGTHPWLVVFCERCLWAGPTRGLWFFVSSFGSIPLALLKPCMVFVDSIAPLSNIGRQYFNLESRSKAQLYYHPQIRFQSTTMTGISYFLPYWTESNPRTNFHPQLVLLCY
jgi:hypothetical protein